MRLVTLPHGSWRVVKFRVFLFRAIFGTFPSFVTHSLILERSLKWRKKDLLDCSSQTSIAITFGEGRAYHLVFCFHVCFLALCMICVWSSLEFLLFYGFIEGGILLNLLLFWLSFPWVFLMLISMGCVGKGLSWTSLVRVSSHGERREKRVECMGLYLPFHACIVE